MTQQIDWAAIGPAVCLVAAGLAALLLDAFVPRFRAFLPTVASLSGIAAALVLLAASYQPRATFCLTGGPPGAQRCSWVVDHVTLVWWVVVLVAAGLVALLLQPAIGTDELPAGETHLLLLFSASGALALAAAGDLVTLLVAMEAVSLPAFALVGLRRADRQGAEAALKFFVVSVVATAFSLLGISLVYGATGSVFAASVSASLTDGTAMTPVVGVGMVLTLVALGFKIAAVPFQVWVPDTYVGAPIPVAAYLSVVSKVAGLAGLTILLVRFFPSYADTWTAVIAAAAALTMTVGNLAALRQQHAVRLLAWSSVAQAGYLLVPLAAGGGSRDIGAIQSYAAMYAIVNLGAFAAALVAASFGAVQIADFAGLARAHPWLGGSLAFALLCLAGLPPGVIGLVAKVVIFQSAVDANLVWLAVVMAVNVAIGLVYYLRFLTTMLRPASALTRATPDPVAWTSRLVVGATLVAAVALSILPGILFDPIFP